MIVWTEVGMFIHSAAVPFFPEAKEFAEMGLVPGRAQGNLQVRAGMVDVKSEVPDYMSDILFDPQTSGGLLISVPDSAAEALLQSMHQEGIADAAIIGEITAAPKGKVTVI